MATDGSDGREKNKKRIIRNEVPAGLAESVSYKKSWNSPAINARSSTDPFDSIRTNRVADIKRNEAIDANATYGGLIVSAPKQISYDEDEEDFSLVDYLHDAFSGNNITTYYLVRIFSRHDALFSPPESHGSSEVPEVRAATEQQEAVKRLKKRTFYARAFPPEGLRTADLPLNTYVTLAPTPDANNTVWKILEVVSKGAADGKYDENGNLVDIGIGGPLGRPTAIPPGNDSPIDFDDVEDGDPCAENGNYALTKGRSMKDLYHTLEDFFPSADIPFQDIGKNKYTENPVNSPHCERDLDGDGTYKQHVGYDFRAAIGTPLRAVYSGKVLKVNRETGDFVMWLFDESNEEALNSKFADYKGDGPNGEKLQIVYRHMDTIDVDVGDFVSTGQLVGTTGNKGKAEGPHLHYEIKWDKKVSSAQGSGTSIPAFRVDPSKDKPSQASEFNPPSGPQPAP